LTGPAEHERILNRIFQENSMDNRILFIRMRLLGDIVFTIPSVLLYKKNFPENEIYYLVEQRFREVAEIIPGVKEVITLPDHMGLGDIIRFRRTIKKLGFPTVIDFHSGPRSALLTYLSGAKLRIGYQTPNRNWAYNRTVPRKSEKHPSHSVSNQAKLLTTMGIDIKEIPFYPEINISEDQVSKELREISDFGKKIVIHVGAKKRYRDWGKENFASLIKELKQDHWKIFLIGKGEEEETRGQYLRDQFNVYDFTGKISIKDILFLIARSDVYFGADSGPLQLASLTKTPIVALFGPNIPEVSGPYRKENVTIIQLNLDCRPCAQKRCNFDEVKCMKGIDVADVYQAIKAF
jgi:ADP-heptose:LPS heptosyltransferase